MPSLFEFCIVVLLLFVIYSWGKKEGFENNNYYFQGNENDSMYVGQLIQPRLIHKINIPAEY
jgi:hypothetical protein